MRALLPPLLPYAWMAICALLTWDVLNHKSVRARAERLFLSLGRRRKVLLYFGSAFIGAALFTGYWWSIQRVFGSRLVASKSESKDETSRPEPTLGNGPSEAKVLKNDGVIGKANVSDNTVKGTPGPNSKVTIVEIGKTGNIGTLDLKRNNIEFQRPGDEPNARTKQVYVTAWRSMASRLRHTFPSQSTHSIDQIRDGIKKDNAYNFLLSYIGNDAAARIFADEKDPLSALEREIEKKATDWGAAPVAK